MEIIVIVSAFIANLITSWVKPQKDHFTKSELETRALVIRIVNALLGLIASVVAAFLVGQELDMTQIQTYIEIVLTGLVTFATSQGMYALAKKG